MKRVVSSLLLLAGVFLLAGCQKGLFERKGGVEVRFTVDSSPKTKTAYDGGSYGGYDRIAWIDGDQVLIWGDNAHVNGSDVIVRNASYDIDANTIQNNNSKSTANLVLKETGGLIFDENANTYNFAAIYPATGFSTISMTDDGIVKSVKPIIPASQTLTDGFPDMSKAVLIGTPVNVEFAQPVRLEFNPIYTMFQFTICAEKDMKVTGVDLISSKVINKEVEFGPSTMNGPYDLNFNFSQGWSISVPNEVTEENSKISATFATPIQLTKEEGATTTNTATFAVLAVPNDITGMHVVFHVITEDGEETRTLKVSYAKDDESGKYSKGDPINFEKCKKHNITGITLPANMSTNVVIDLQVIPWEDETGTVTYGVGQPAITSNALEYASGASDNEGSDRRINNHFAGSNPIHAYFYVFSPVGATWKMKISGDTDKFTVASPEATSSSSTELSGTVGSGTDYPGRVDFSITKNGATASNKIQFTFYVVVGGREISINSEIIRGSALTITGESDN